MPPPPKSDAPPPPAAAAAKAAEKQAAAPEPPVTAAAAAAPRAGIGAWIPSILSIVVAPAITWAVAQYVLLPKLETKLNLPPPAADESLPQVATDEHGKPKAPSVYKFEGVVVNLAGTMGTRYLKTSIIITGDPKSKVDIEKVFDANRTKLYDATISVLSSLTLSDLEEAGAKNVVKAKLVAAYNSALEGKKVADQVYFADFVIQ